MPLKHATETLLVVVLAVVVALTGILVALLPPLPAAVAPWSVLFVAAVAYPLALYPLFRARRADYEFRALHFVPLAIVFGWLVLQLGGQYAPPIRRLAGVYTWGWTAVAVCAGLVLLVVFCLKVLRQRWTRMAVIAGVFVPFVGLVLADVQWSVRSRTTAMLFPSWGAGQATPNTPVIARSADPEEEAYRRNLRRRERREDRLDRLHSSEAQTVSVPVRPASQPLLATTSKAGGKKIGISRPVDIPPRLTGTGPIGMEHVAVFFLAGYTATVHGRARRRRRL